MFIMSYEGIINLFRIIMATIVAIAPFFGAVFYNKLKKYETKVFVIIYFAIYSLIMIGWVFGKISGVNWRLVPIEITSLILTILLIYELMDVKLYFRFGCILLIPVIIYSAISISNIASISIYYEKENKIFSEIKLLEENNCTYGYGTFWNANHVTALTDNKIKVRNIDIESGEIKFRGYQTDSSWYTGETLDNENYFIILTKSEYSGFNLNNYPVKDVIMNDNFVLINLMENIKIQ